MRLLDITYIRDNCDYSFGDESGIHIGGYMKVANKTNIEFLKIYEELKVKKDYMTLFIDNIRLYRREGIKYTSLEQENVHIKLIKDRKIDLLKNEDLLKLCGELPDMKFVIFSGFEDTPIDEFIFDKIPENVLAIYASNAISFGGKVKPMPYGLQRKLNTNDLRHEILLNRINDNPTPDKLLYINHSLSTNPDRININNYFQNKSWVTIEYPMGLNYSVYNRYLSNIKNHKFMICPSGNALGCECHRDWEVIYMRRVPVVLRSKYLEYIFKDIPVLFVDNFLDITEEFLRGNEYLFEEMQSFDFEKLDIEKIYSSIIREVNECI